MDIVEWLREKAKGFFKPTSTRLNEAADEIERLREALKYYADKKEEDWKNGDDGVVARAALKGDE